MLHGWGHPWSAMTRLALGISKLVGLVLGSVVIIASILVARGSRVGSITPMFP